MNLKSTCTGLAFAALLISGCGQSNERASESSLQTVIGGDETNASSAVDFSKPTRFLLVGYSDGMGTQFVQSAKAAAFRYRDLGWNEQIVFIAKPDVNGMSDAAALSRFGVKVVFDDANTHFGSSWLLRYLKNFPKIASLEFHGHSSVWGLGLEDGAPRLSTDTPQAELTALRTRFLPDAFATLHGCNSGALFASVLSAAWKIPVSAAVTGTNFQELHKNGKWYFNDPGLFPAGGWATTNSVSYKVPRPCSSGACVRMKPTNQSYSGFWGDYEGGLGFYKTFCATSVNNDACARGAARSSLAVPTTKAITLASNWSQLRESTLDFLCPNPSTDAGRVSCFSALPAAAAAPGRGTAYSPFRGTTLTCTVRGCKFDDVCEKDDTGAPIPGTCTRASPANPSPREYVEEYRLIFKGFALLKGEASPVPEPLFP